MSVYFQQINEQHYNQILLWLLKLLNTIIPLESIQMIDDIIK